MGGESPVPYPTEWPVARLGELALKIGSGATPKGGEEAYLPQRSKYALVRSQNVFDRRFETSGLAFISDEQAERLKGVLLRRDDLLLNITGDGITFGRSCRIPDEILPACVNQHVAIVRVNSDLADPGYVLAYLTHPRTKAYIEAFNAGGSRRAITKGHIESFQLALPPLSEQRAIAKILGALDDKIDLNRRTNETLEAIAQALFKSWFVDFDPVRAKTEGRDPGLPKDLADLFPDSFEESELGENPQGWRSGAIGDIAEINARNLRAGHLLDVIDYIEISEVMHGEVASVPRYTRGTEPSRARRCLRHGDTVLSTVRPDRGAHFLCLNPPETLIGSTGFAVVSPLYGHWAFLYSAVTRPAVGIELGRLADGGAYPAVRPEAILNLPLAFPADMTLIAAFEDIVRPFLERASRNREESKTLAALRDTLLPKLLSGELRIKDAERFVGRQL